MRCLVSAVLLACGLVIPAVCSADNLVFQGSTTFNRRIMLPYKAAIEAASRHTLTVIPNKTSTGIAALFDKRADFAMSSAPLDTELETLKIEGTAVQADRLRVHEIASVRMAFAVHSANPVRTLSRDQMTRVLLGEISDWSELGGNAGPIKVVLVREGGGVQASVEAALLGNRKVSPASPIRVQISTQLIKVVEQELMALGLAQQSTLKGADVAEVQLDQPIIQPLSLVTLGPPNAAMMAVIDATKRIAAHPAD